MRSPKLSTVTDQQLIKNEKRLKALTLVFTGVLLILFAVTIFSAIKKGFSAVIVTPIALFSLLMVLLSNWNELKKEIKERNL